jgi:DNA-binding transcriptional LysR family regulator
MMSIDDIHIRRLDFTLLIVFERLMALGNMTAVASGMGLTQSAVSHAVARLRSVFDDPLFVRRGAGVEPTPRALLLRPALSSALAGIRDAIGIGSQFDPAQSRRRFCIAAPDTIVAAIAPAILGELGRNARACQVMFRSFSHTEAARAVARR